MGMRLNYGGSRSRSCRVVQDSSSAEAMEPENCCWSDLPEELLREVLVRVEASQRDWPLRKSIVACAGVCRSWRFIMKEVLGLPELTGILTFPISIKQPGPRESLIRCFIKRNQSTHTYDLYLSLTQALADDGKFLLAARKCRRATGTDYIISLNTDDMSKGSSKYIGKLRCFLISKWFTEWLCFPRWTHIHVFSFYLFFWVTRSNFLGTKYVIYDALPPHAGAKMMKTRSTVLVGPKQFLPGVPTGSYPVAHISYELNVLGSSRGPRRMHCIMDAIPASAIKPGGAVPSQTEFRHSGIDSPPSFSFFRSKSNRMDNILSGPLDGLRDGQLILKNKSPRWHEQLQCWCLNFHGRVTFASVKNFQLVASVEGEEAGPEHEKVILQFGKVGKDVFTMDYCYPISAFQAFAICLSSFDTKIACE